MERDEMREALFKLQELISVHEDFLLVLFDWAQEQRAVRDSFAAMSKDVENQLLFAELPERVLELQQEGTKRFLEQLDARLKVRANIFDKYDTPSAAAAASTPREDL